MVGAVASSASDMMDLDNGVGGEEELVTLLPKHDPTLHPHSIGSDSTASAAPADSLLGAMTATTHLSDTRLLLLI